MNMRVKLASIATIIVMAAAPSLADQRPMGGHSQSMSCPPGLAKKGNGCQPPGQAKKHDKGPAHSKKAPPKNFAKSRAPHRDNHRQVGERLRRNEYGLIKDPGRYGLKQDRRWSYMRDDQHIYRVDRDTMAILQVLRLATGFGQ